MDSFGSQKEEQEWAAAGRAGRIDAATKGVLTKHWVNRDAVYELYVQCHSFMAFMAEIELMGLNERFPNWERCKAELQAAVEKAEALEGEKVVLRR